MINSTWTYYKLLGCKGIVEHLKMKVCQLHRWKLSKKYDNDISVLLPLRRRLRSKSCFVWCCGCCIPKGTLLFIAAVVLYGCIWCMITFAALWSFHTKGWGSYTTLIFESTAEMTRTSFQVALKQGVMVTISFSGLILWSYVSWMDCSAKFADVNFRFYDPNASPCTNYGTCTAHM